MTRRARLTAKAAISFAVTPLRLRRITAKVAVAVNPIVQIFNPPRAVKTPSALPFTGRD
jgi:hypothetical protein